MDLGHPLRSLIPSLESAVLEVLAGAEVGMGVSQIARQAARGTRGGFMPVLDRLVEHGLVLAEPANHGSLYRLNREHLLAPAVLLAVVLRGDLIDRLAAGIEQFLPAPVHASVFGSFARGEAGADSDIDVLVLAGCAHDIDCWEEQREQLRHQVRRWTGNHCQWVVLPLEQIRKLYDSGEPIVDHWLMDSLPLVGQPLSNLLGHERTPQSASFGKRE